MKLCDEGGDWERKNKIKVYNGVESIPMTSVQVYEALFHLTVRDFKKAADLFIDATATFATLVATSNAIRLMNVC